MHRPFASDILKSSPDLSRNVGIRELRNLNLITTIVYGTLNIISRASLHMLWKKE